MANKKNDSQLHPPQPQVAYLIRCWREADTWRFSVEDVASRRQRRYDSLEELLEALWDKLSAATEGEPSSGHADATKKPD